MAVRLSLRLRALQTRADAGGGAVADSVASSATSAVASSYERSKRYVVWLVKQLDSHLCDLDRRIEKHIANRAQAAREGAYEQIAHEQNKLGELCVEHKARLDSMLFFWILGGGLSFAGWVSAMRRAAGHHAPETLAALQPASTATAPSRVDIAAEVEAGVRAALLRASASAAAWPAPAGSGSLATAADGGALAAPVYVMQPPRDDEGDEEARRLLQWAAWERRCTCAAAVGACVLSAASLVVASSRR